MNRLPPEVRIRILRMLVEGLSMRSISRVCNVSINTVSKLLVDAGIACKDFHDVAVWGLESSFIECDEIWSFCYAKQKRAASARGVIDRVGDVWTWTALDRDSKLLVTWHVGSREPEIANEFMEDLARRLEGRIQLSTDGYRAYPEAVESAFGRNVDYAMIVGKTKYSMSGKPNLAVASQSWVERHNLTMRMAMRRFTRSTNAFSKKVENHEHALALYGVWYNWVRPHLSLSKPYATTPAMAAGLTTSLHGMDWLLKIVNNYWERKSKARRKALT